MKLSVRTRLALLNSLFSIVIVSIFAAWIYFSAMNDRSKEFQNILKQEAITKANVFFYSEIPASTLQKIYQNNRQTIHEVQVAIYKAPFEEVYHDAANIDYVKENPQMIRQILKKEFIYFSVDTLDAIGLKYQIGQQDYVITAAAYDAYGFRKLKNLQDELIFAASFILLFILAASFFFTYYAFSPIRKMIQQVKTISASNLGLRVAKGKGRDEISELAKTFNTMLDRLEQSFDAQKQFVSNVAHEIRTPLTGIIAEIELASGSEVKKKELAKALKRIKSDANRLSELSSDMLDLARSEYDRSSIQFKEERIDEILMETRGELLKMHPDFHVQLQFIEPMPEPHQLQFHCNKYLISTAFRNLMENACKYGVDQECEVLLSVNQSKIVLSFENRGEAISQEEKALIFNAFYRGKAHRNKYQGTGIGLSLTKKIILLHSGSIELKSSDTFKNAFEVTLFS
ncbi:MAG: HAMP domain-containing protein [Cyclobacteriaceae bacterium]|nr:HAMP domain-containing protein [Cyclobacteriaceae bacterium]MCH8516363.1 HAMP domain-containing protein [Cyclobacteriaceae bacterium]